jgi:hypothetical protein
VEMLAEVAITSEARIKSQVFVGYILNACFPPANHLTRLNVLRCSRVFMNHGG